MATISALSQISVKDIEATYHNESKNNSESTCKTTCMFPAAVFHSCMMCLPEFTWSYSHTKVTQSLITGKDSYCSQQHNSRSRT